MTDTGATPWHESIEDYLRRGGDPAEHPSSEFLIEVACRVRWTVAERELAIAEAQLAGLADQARSAKDRRVESHARWTIELLTNRELADGFVDGLPDEVVRREEARALDFWDKEVHPWAAEVVLLRDGFRCDITGRGNRLVALHLSPRQAEDADDLFLEVGAVMGICDRGIGVLEAALKEVVGGS